MPVRFRFCGDDEVPDWILAAINQMSRIDTQELETLVKRVTKAILQDSNKIENDKKLDLEMSSVEADKLMVPAAAISFILRSSTGYEVTEAKLFNELQQIGLPHQHAIVLSRIYTENAANLKRKAEQLSLRCSIPKTVDCVKKDDDTFNMNIKAWHADSSSIQNYLFTLTKDQLELMVEGSTRRDYIDTITRMAINLLLGNRARRLKRKQFGDLAQ